MSVALKTNTNLYISKIASVISEKAGIQLGDKQFPMIEARLLRRMKQVGVETWDDYFKHFENNRATEVEELVSLLTTHHTFFFREFIHFEALEKMLPTLIERARSRIDKTIRIWSAACSRGQEVYSLSMFFKHHLSIHAPDVQFSILGTDIDKQSILIAKNGVYSRDEIKQVPLMYLSTHWAKGTGEIQNFVKAKNSVKDHCKFDVANLLELSPLIKSAKFDIIFCRNVFIYFTIEQIKSIAKEMTNSLVPDGYFFVSVSESLNGMSLPLESAGPAVYKHVTEESRKLKVVPTTPSSSKSAPPQNRDNVSSPKLSAAIPQQTPTAELARPLRVFCIDDSSSILFLLKNILTTTEGFEIVGTASDGLDAAKKLPAANADIVTLDIHMPNQNGLEYLKANYNSNHPPVVMITAVSRDDSDLALTALQLGATDYVEKPTMNNFNDRADEIRTKLRVASKAKKLVKQGSTLNIDLDKSFKKFSQIQNPENKLRIMITSVSYRHALVALFKEFSGTQPPTYIFVEGADSALPAFARQLSTDSGRTVQYVQTPTGKEQAGSISLCDLRTSLPTLHGSSQNKACSVLVFGDVSKNASQNILSWKTAQILIEENTNKDTELAKIATDAVPVTSFTYLSNEFFAKDKK